MLSGQYRVATRKSALARKQTDMAVALFERVFPGTQFDIIPMSTKGDEQLEWSLETTGGKGLFTSELERAIVAGEADFAVHSAKDVPTEMTEGIVLAGYLPRERPEDVLIVREGISIPQSVATGSPRRRGQLQAYFPQVTWQEIRGNVETRLNKIRDGYADATIMAAAGLRRLGIHSREGLRFCPLPVRTSIPAAGQAAIAIQCRKDDAAGLAPALCQETRIAVELERRVLGFFGGGCHSPSAAHYCAPRLYVYHEHSGKRVFNVPDPDNMDFEFLRETLKIKLT